jgi:hypothetical protein
MRAVTLLFDAAQGFFTMSGLAGEFLGLSKIGDSAFFIHGDKNCIKKTASINAAGIYQGLICSAQEFKTQGAEGIIPSFFQEAEADFAKHYPGKTYIGLFVEGDFNEQKTFIIHKGSGSVLSTRWANFNNLSASAFRALDKWAKSR